jgi:hypothetical protein
MTQRPCYPHQDFERILHTRDRRQRRAVEDDGVNCMDWINARGRGPLTCLDCSSVISSEAFIPLSVINLWNTRHKSALNSKQPDVFECDALRTRWGHQRRPGHTSQPRNAPTDHATTTLPVFAPFESRITCDELLQDRVKLVFGAQSKLESVHECDKTLHVIESTLINGQGDEHHLSRLRDPFSCFGARFTGVLYSRWNTNPEPVKCSWVVHLLCGMLQIAIDTELFKA